VFITWMKKNTRSSSAGRTEARTHHLPRERQAHYLGAMADDDRPPASPSAFDAAQSPKPCPTCRGAVPAT
ncbi:MAG: hypothetical protein OEW85_12680, partial [Acidimicrobiia bacterium]|nr:hypothetical protein [Acidimicrobiia bacterium]